MLFTGFKSPLQTEFRTGSNRRAAGPDEGEEERAIRT